MWLLSSDGDLFGGKRLWLPPGSTHLLGRTSGKTDNGERVQFINHKTVSRQHLIITVGQVSTADLSKLHKRTSITIKDGSKAGTILDGERFSKESRKLDGSKTEHVIRLGSYEQEFKLTWLPVILSCGSPGKPKNEAFAQKREQLSGTDINILAEYVSNETTHAIVRSRNHPTCMQALLQAKWVVDYTWLDAVEEVTRRTTPDANGEMRSALEEDFDANWPREDEYLPPAKGEPVKRPDEYLLPRPERADVFQHFIFIVLGQGQFDNLLPMITTGGGKTLLWEVDEQSKTEDFVEYVKGVAGKKGSGHYNLNEQTGKGGVVVVRLNENTDWGRKFMYDADLALKQRSIQQNEFLDLILMNDASAARQPLPETQSSVPNVPASRTRAQMPVVQSPSPPQEDQPMAGNEEQVDVVESRARSVHEVEDEPAAEQPAEKPAEEEEQPAATKRKWNRRAITKSRFQGFDDFDTSQFTKPPSPEPEPTYADPSQADSAQGMDVEPSQPSRTQRTQQSGQKRPAPIEEEADEGGNMLDGLLLGQAAMKRRRTEAVAKGEKNGFAKSFTESEKAATEKTERAKKKEKQIDVKAALAKKKKEEDEDRRRKDEEALRQQLEGVDIGTIEPDVEEMEILVRERPARAAGNAENSSRWDPAWNGRKNFKKFQRQGQRRDGPRLQRVIVPLEEAVKKPYGAEDDYWLMNPSTTGTSRSKSKSQSQGQSQALRGTGTQGQEETQQTPASLNFRRALQRSREEDAEHDADDSEIAAVRGTNSAGRAVGPSSGGWSAVAAQSQTFGTDSQRKAIGKRPASSQGSGAAAKKARTVAPAGTSGTRAGAAPAAAAGDEGGLKFRRRRRD